MNKTINFLPIFLLLLLSVFLVAFRFTNLPAVDSVQEDVRRYDRKSGIISYQMIGAVSGGEVLYFDDWGMKEARHINQLGSKRVELLLGKEQIEIDLNMKKGKKTYNPYLKLIKEGGAPEVGMSLDEKLLEDVGGEIVGTESIQGYPCEIWEVPKIYIKTWIWKGLALRTESKLPGYEYITEVKKIKLDCKVPEKKFKIPGNIYFE